MNGKRIIVTGVTRGLGLAIARLLLTEGASLIGTGRDAGRLQQASRQLSRLGDFEGTLADLSRPAQASAAIVRAAEKRWGVVDGLINNAAISGPVESLDLLAADELRAVLDVNLLGPHYLLRALLPLLESGAEPTVINVSSEAGQFKNLSAERGAPAYILSKYALNGLSLLWARHLRGRVAINCVHPGWVRSDMGGQDAPEDTMAGGRRVVRTLKLPFHVTGQFFFDGEKLAW